MSKKASKKSVHALCNSNVVVCLLSNFDFDTLCESGFQHVCKSWRTWFRRYQTFLTWFQDKSGGNKKKHKQQLQQDAPIVNERNISIAHLPDSLFHFKLNKQSLRAVNSPGLYTIELEHLPFTLTIYKSLLEIGTHCEEDAQALKKKKKHQDAIKNSYFRVEQEFVVNKLKNSSGDDDGSATPVSASSETLLEEYDDGFGDLLANKRFIPPPDSLLPLQEIFVRKGLSAQQLQKQLAEQQKLLQEQANNSGSSSGSSSGSDDDEDDDDNGSNKKNKNKNKKSSKKKKEVIVNLDPSPLVFVMILHGGNFAGGIFNGEACIAHKTFHAYVTRKKQGKRQASHDKKSHAQSGGAFLRRRNEEHFRSKVKELLQQWHEPYLKKCKAVFMHCPGPVNRQIVFKSSEQEEASSSGNSYEDTYLKKDEENEDEEQMGLFSSKDKRIKGISCDSGPTPNFTQVVNAYQKITNVTISRKKYGVKKNKK